MLEVPVAMSNAVCLPVDGDLNPFQNAVLTGYGRTDPACKSLLFVQVVLFLLLFPVNIVFFFF